MAFLKKIEKFARKIIKERYVVITNGYLLIQTRQTETVNHVLIANMSLELTWQNNLIMLEF